MSRSLAVPLSLALVLVVVGGAGCQRTAACASLDDCVAVETGTSTDTGPGTGADDGGWGDPQLDVNRDVDILFVIDNSGSMGEEQALLAANVGGFVNLLEDVGANYRIGITTSDNSNPWCPAGATTPEGGKLVLRSCKERLGDFLFNNGTVDVQDLACNDICTLSAAELEILPTTTDSDSEAKPRPWLENIEGHKNIPASTDPAAAFACFGPQGINGCGFESQLESMYLALVRSQTVDEDSYGFMRDGAILAVVILSDEADCSYNKDYAQIFESDGNHVFWSDPAAQFPSSAVCWNAGVECYGDPSGYDSCDPVNKDVVGNIDVADTDAVLHPISRYIGLLEGLQQQKQELDYDNEIIVTLIGGVDSNGAPFYADVGDSDPEFQATFGIGPGCTAPNPLDPNAPVKAVPPVRMRDVTEAFTPDNMFSICEPDYAVALEAIAKRISAQIKPACYTQCAADTNPDTAIVDAVCSVSEDPPGPDDNVDVVECLRDANGYVVDPFGDYQMPSDNVNVCHVVLTDPGGLSPDPFDDLSGQCLDEGFNVEFEIVRRPGYPAVGGTAIEAGCELAELPSVTCPGL